MLLVPHLIPVRQSERRQLASRVHFLRGSTPGRAHHFQGGGPTPLHVNSLIQKTNWFRSTKSANGPHCTILPKNAQSCIIGSSRMPPPRVQPMLHGATRKWINRAV